MNKFITNVLGPVALIVQVMLLIDLGSDLYAKYKAKKAEKNNIVSPETEEEPVVEEAAGLFFFASMIK